MNRDWYKQDEATKVWFLCLTWQGKSLVIRRDLVVAATRSEMPNKSKVYVGDASEEHAFNVDQSVDEICVQLAQGSQ